MSRIKSKPLLWIVLPLVLGLTTVVADATTLTPMTFDELTQRATAIVRVRCVGVQSAWADGEIWTDSRFEILEESKADVFGADQRMAATATAAHVAASRSDRASPAATLDNFVLRQLGGKLGGLHSRVEGVPEFTPGEEAYLFLWRRAGQPYRVLGWAQGTFRIARDPRTGAARVTQDSAVTVFHSETREFQASGVRNISLAAFQQKLRRSLSAAPR